jgi:hypothetical protein
MAKDHGLGNSLYISGIDVSGEARNWDVTSPVQMLDTTGLRKAANERITGQRSGTFKWNSHFDPLSAGYAALAALPYTDAVITLPHRETLGQVALCTVTKQIGYDPQRDDKGQVLFAVDEQTNASWADWGVLATPGLRTDIAATNGAGVDHGSTPALAVGLQAYLHVSALTGTNVVVKLQHSADDAVGDPYTDVTGAAFTSVTAAPNGQWLATSRTLQIKRWVRVVTTGVFTSATFAVGVVVNDVAVAL